nr:MAG TPA: hypothetical protein [Caudoviricetes sp.]
MLGISRYCVSIIKSRRIVTVHLSWQHMPVE